MAKFTIDFIQRYTYEVEADSFDEAFEQAEEEFCDDMRSSIANTLWDEFEARDEDDEIIESGCM